MRKLCSFMAILLIVVSMFSVTLAPAFTYKSDGDHVAEVKVDLDLSIVDILIDGEYLFDDNTLGLDVVASFERGLGDLKIGLFLDTPIDDIATPTLGFFFKSAPLGPEYFKLFAEVGTGYYADPLFGAKLVGDFIADPKDVSGVLKLGSEFELAKLDFDAFLGTGYYLLDESYSVYASVKAKLFDFLDVAAKFDILPEFAFSVRVSTIIEF